MIRSLRPSAPRHLSRPRAVGLMFFVLVAIPVLMFSFAWGIDATRVFIAQRQAARVAEAAAVAAAFQFRGATTSIDQVAARRVAQETIDAARSEGSLSLVSDISVDSVTFSQLPNRTETVRVRLTYRVGGLLFAGYFARPGGIEASVVRTASVCIPGATGQNVTDGFCKRPDLEQIIDTAGD